MNKYFYVATVLDKGTWVSLEGCLNAPDRFALYIGSEWWPYTRREARLLRTDQILQFENKPPYKFVKVVR